MILKPPFTAPISRQAQRKLTYGNMVLFAKNSLELTPPVKLLVVYHQSRKVLVNHWETKRLHLVDMDSIVHVIGTDDI